MEKKVNKKSKKNTTKYGEFISSFFSWISLDEQKNRAKKLADMTKNEKENNS